MASEHRDRPGVGTPKTVPSATTKRVRSPSKPRAHEDQISEDLKFLFKKLERSASRDKKTNQIVKLLLKKFERDKYTFSSDQRKTVIHSEQSSTGVAQVDNEPTKARSLESGLEVPVRRPSNTDILAEIKRRLVDEFGGASRKDRENIVTEIKASLGLSSASIKVGRPSVLLVPLPKVPPERWPGVHKSSDLSPAHFIDRVYKRWLGAGMTQAKLQHLDLALYRAYHNWLQNSNEKPPKGFYLPTKQAWNDRLLSDPSLFEQLSPEEQQRLHRTAGTRPAHKR